jgi:hypothetical protein
MSQEYDNTNRWSLFKNDRKEKDTQPDYTGTLNVDGTEYYLDAWLKEGRKGKFFSGKIKQKGAGAERTKPAEKAPAFEEDDLPF